MKIFLLPILSLLSCFCFSQEREIQNLKDGWKFALGTNDNAYQLNFNDKKWQDVSLPHDWAIAGPFEVNGDGNTAKLPWKGEGWYRYHWTQPAKDDKQVYLLFDGVMAFPTIYVNGSMAGKWDYGYNSFYVNISSLIKPGQDNVIAVHVDTRQHDSRWYPGAGIYRKVQMITFPNLHAKIWGTQITTPIIKSNYAQVEVATEIQNEGSASLDQVSVEQVILSPNGKTLISQNEPLRIAAKKSGMLRQTFVLNNPERWEIGDGKLYTLKTIVYNGSQIMDTDSSTFGIRTVRFTADDGFYLNDHRVQLKGVCLHHDQGPLGAAFYPGAMERQLQIMQSMGCNAIRTSHNAPAPELLDLCDRMGILVLDELFDKYDRKADIVDTTDFESFAHRNVENFVRRDRNHPSIFLWSVGNEIGDVQWNINGGFDKLKTMVNYVRKFDSSRPVTLVCDSRNSAQLRHFDFYDVHSWNYGRRYDLARQLEPNKAVIISESASTVSTRGFYEWPLPAKKTDFTSSLQVSSYDLNAPEWAEIPDDDFMWQEDENYVAGEFVWTGFDYLGEPTPYSNAEVKARGMSDREASVSSYFGMVDLAGFPKDRYYLYKSYWDQEDTTIHILPHWNWAGREGQKIPVFVYTSGDCAELFVNGNSQGMKCKVPDSSVSTERFRLRWDEVTYQPGELKVIAYKEKEKIGEEKVNTVGTPVELRVTTDRDKIKGDGLDLCYLTIEAVDVKGNVYPLANNEVKIGLTGNGQLIGVSNGNPQSTISFHANQLPLFYGKAIAIVRGNTGNGSIHVRVESSGLKPAEKEITVVN